MIAKAAQAAILGITPEKNDRIRLWMWSPEASLQILGTFTPGSALGVAMRLVRKQPDLQVFTAHAAAVLFADLVDTVR